MSLVQMSVSAAFIIVVVVIVRALALYKLPKRTFFALWGVVLCRLLIPVSIPAKTSAFGLIEYIRAQMAGVSASATVPPSMQEAVMWSDTAMSPVADTVTKAILPDTILAFLSPLFLVWLVGIAILGAYFVFVYFKCRREFSASLPTDNDFILAWREAHKLKRAYSVRISDKIAVPLTYGVFRPVILLPKRVDLSDEKRLSYILVHEFVHIRRFDALTKLVATAALCVHWFNPLVWVMYILLNRDIEISCDEKVVRELGGTPKSAYALMLIGMAERKGAISPLYSSFSKYAIKERVNAIMKNKKISMIGILVAVALVAGTITVFATSAVVNVEAGENSVQTPRGVYFYQNPYGNYTPATEDELRGDSGIAYITVTENYIDFARVVDTDNSVITHASGSYTYTGGAEKPAGDWTVIFNGTPYSGTYDATENIITFASRTYRKFNESGEAATNGGIGEMAATDPEYTNPSRDFAQSLTEADIASAKKTAEAHYNALNSFTLLSLAFDSDMNAWWWVQHGNNDPGDGEDFTPGNLVVFYAHGRENTIPREITLGRASADVEWKVINEGY
jgi:beta-lactamase regulating signal transducer with metallopeptidase domain